MRLSLQLTALALGAGLLAGCSGNVDSDPSRFYLESNRPVELQQLARELPQQKLESSSQLKVYSYESRELVTSRQYAAQSVNLAQVAADLPTQGEYWVDFQISTPQGPVAYRGHLKDGLFSLE